MARQCTWCGERHDGPCETEAAERERIDGAIAAKRSILEHAGGRRGVSGRVPCPVCGGELRYSIAASNGHIWACCGTAGCVKFLE